MSRTDELLEAINYAKLSADVLWKDIDTAKHRKLLDGLAAIVKRDAEAIGTIYDKEAGE